MIGRRTIAELDFGHEVGVYAGPGPFRAQELRASARIGGWSRGAFLLNERWPDSDLGSRYLYSVARAEWLDDKSDPSSVTTSVLLYPVDGSLTPSAARKLVHVSQTIHGLGEYEMVGDAARALAAQAGIDRAREQMLAKTPWLIDPSYDGDYAGALWARDVNGAFGSFPVNVLDRPHPPYLPMFAALAPPPGWPRASLYLTSPFTADRPLPTLDRPPVTLEVFAVLPGEDEKIVGEQVERGDRVAIATLEIGPRPTTDSERRG